MRSLRLLPGALLFYAITATAQPFYLSVSGGAAGYSGDLQATNYNPHNIHGTAGLSLKYNLSPHWTARIGYNYGYLSASDVNNDPSLQFRNLSFATDIHEGNLILEYDLVNADYSRIIPYMMAGVGLFHFNPYYRDASYTKVLLQPIGTEGQYLPGSKLRPYKLTQTNLISGGGIKFKVSDNIIVSYESGMRRLSTDYLDDVSTFYPNTTNPNLIKHSYKESASPSDFISKSKSGKMRGSPRSNDMYYFNTLSLTLGIGNLKMNSRTYRDTRRSTRCPTRF